MAEEAGTPAGQDGGSGTQAPAQEPAPGNPNASATASQALEALGGLTENKSIIDMIGNQGNPPAPEGGGQPPEGGGQPPAQEPGQPSAQQPGQEPAAAEPPAPGQPPEPTPAPEAPAAEPPQGGSAAPEGAAEPPASGQEPAKVDSPIYGGEVPVPGSQAPPETPTLEIANIGEVDAFVKSNFGFDTFAAMTERVAAMPQMETQLTEAQGKAEQAEQIFAQMPPQLYQSIVAWGKGDDWMSVITDQPVFDFSKTSDQIPAKDLVNTYSKGKFTEEDWTEYNDPDGDPNVKKAIDIAIESGRARFDSDKSVFETQQNTLVQTEQRRTQAFETSVTVARDRLASDFEGVHQNYVSDVENELKNGGIGKLFYNADGTLKPEAGIAYAMAKDGFALMNKYKTISLHQAENNVMEQVLERTPATPPEEPAGGGGQAQPDELSQEFQDYRQDLIGGLKQDKTYGG